MTKPIPDFQSIMLPLLTLLQNGKQYPLETVLKALASEFGLSEDDLRVKVPSGQQPLFKNRVTWAISYLKNAGLIYYPKRGEYKVTEAGIQVLNEGLNRISISYLKKLDAFKNWQSTYSEPDTGNKAASSDLLVEETPEVVIGSAIESLHAKLVSDLLDILKSKTPGEFEAFVLKLLKAMGYGGADAKSFEVVGQSGDNGIDGIIYQDQLGLEPVYVQAKKWADNKVQSKDIRDFIGALSLKGTNKGVFITTSDFTSDAFKTAQMNPHNKIILINGATLGEFAIKYGVGVQVRAAYQIKAIDAEFFDEL